MRKVVIESPYAGDIERNLAYLQRCIFDSLSRDEAPFASHLMYTSVLDDDDPGHRKLGIEAGYVWMDVAQTVVFYHDYGWSTGMNAAYERCRRLNIPHDLRKIGLNP